MHRVWMKGNRDDDLMTRGLLAVAESRRLVAAAEDSMTAAEEMLCGSAEQLRTSRLALILSDRALERSTLYLAD